MLLLVRVHCMRYGILSSPAQLPLTTALGVVFDKNTISVFFYVVHTPDHKHSLIFWLLDSERIKKGFVQRYTGLHTTYRRAGMCDMHLIRVRTP